MTDGSIEASNDKISWPKVQGYLSATRYLQDLFVARQKQDSQFSFEIWAAELNFKSRSYIRMICNGERKLTPHFIDIFSKKMNFNEVEKEHLSLLALYDKTKNPTQKKFFLNKAIENLETPKDRLQIKNYVEFLSSPISPLLQIILAFDDIELTLEQLKLLLNEDSKTIKTNLLQLLNMQLITANGPPDHPQTLWKSNHHSYDVPDLPGNQALLDYHRAHLKIAEKALGIDPQLRRFRSLIVGLSTNEFKELTQEIEMFLKKIINQFNTNQLDNRRIYQINVQAYPMTEIYRK